jgi:hypothetical protein
MLLELSKKDKIWREIAFKICGDHSKADDLVQEMYLKLYNQKKQINSGYIYATLRSIFIDDIRKNKLCLDAKIPIQYEDDIDIQTFEEIEVKFELIDNQINKLLWHEKTIILESSKIGIRPLARQAKISKEIIVKVRKKLKDNVHLELVTLSQKQQKHWELYPALIVRKEKTG